MDLNWSEALHDLGIDLDIISDNGMVADNVLTSSLPWVLDSPYLIALQRPQRSRIRTGCKYDRQSVADMPPQFSTMEGQ